MTDAEGDIVFWFIQAYGGSQLLNYLLETSNYGIEIDPDGDPWVNANDYAGIGGATTSWAERIGAPGIWTVSEVSVSEPSTLATALLSLAVLLLLLWRLRALPVRVYGRPMAPQLES
jgi:hypothetical protein